MDQLFGDEKPKKDKTKKQYKKVEKTTEQDTTTVNNPDQSAEGVTAVKRRERKDRNRAKKENQKKQKLQQMMKAKKEEISLPLIIKMHHSLIESDNLQKNLQDFIDFIYPQEGQQVGFHTKKTKIQKMMGSFESEDDEGSIQYKLKLINPTEDRLDHLATQMKYRIKEGEGECCYRIGVEDDGRAIGLSKQQMYESLKTICTLANRVRADVTVFRIIQGLKGNIVQLLIRKNQKQGINLQIRLLLLGEHGSGKSTLLGVIKSGEKDDGKGYARTKVFTHRDQFMSGVTQTKSHHVIAFDSKGKLYNHQSMTSIQSWLDNSSKILSFIDVAGHKQKQVVSSLCSFFPEYALWVVSGENKSISKSSLELARIFNLPLITVISHLDKMDKMQEMDAVLRVKKVLKELYPDKTPSVIRQMEHAVLFSRITSTEAVIPIFLISSVNGHNIELLTNFFNLLTSMSQLRNNEDLHSEFSISYKYLIDNKIVLAGTVIKGTIKEKQILHLGPDLKGTFRAVEVISIQCMRVPVKIAKCGQICTIGIRLLSYAKQWLQKQPDAIRKGMVLIQSKGNPKASYEFGASFMLYSNDSNEVKITSKCQPVVNTQTTRQICDIIVFPKNEQEDSQVPTLNDFKKKKSKSIDLFHKYKSHHSHNLSHSMIKNGHFDSKKEQTGSSKKIRHKISVDLNDLQEQKPKNKLQTGVLTPIKEQKSPVSKAQRKKRDIQIRFSSEEPTFLRLRFKYYPEYLEKGQKLVINELKLIGKVTQIFY